MGNRGKDLTCVLCCATVPHTTHWAKTSDLVAAVGGFIQQTLIHGEGEEHVSVNAGGMLLGARGVSLCEPCLGETRETTEAGQRVEEYEELVRHLQQRLLKMMRELQALLDAYRERLQGLERKIRESGQDKILSRNRDAHRFRREVTRVAENLKGFRDDLMARSETSSGAPDKMESLKLAEHVEEDKNASGNGFSGDEAGVSGDDLSSGIETFTSPSPDPPEKVEDQEQDNNSDNDLSGDKAYAPSENASDPEDSEHEDDLKDPDFEITSNQENLPSRIKASTKYKAKLVNYNRGFLESAFTAACPSAASVTRTAKNLNLKCDVCSKSGFKTRPLLYYHWWQKHSGRFNNRRQCPTCGKTMTHSALQKHKPKCAAGTIRPWRRNKTVTETQIKMECPSSDEDARSLHDEDDDSSAVATKLAFQAACPDAPTQPNDPFSPEISCGVCGKKGWKLRRYLYEHWYRIHYNPRRRTDGKLNCDMCEAKGFTTKLSLSNHQFKIHGAPQAPAFRAACPSSTEKKTDFTCDICQKTGFKLRSDLYNHWYRSHKDRPGRKKTPARRPAAPVRGNKRDIQCEECGIVLKHRKSMWNHRKFKHGHGLPDPKDETKWPCSICGQQFKNQRLQRCHEANHVPREERPHITCPLCHRKVLETSWNKHRRCNCPALQARRKEPVKCDDCGKMFKDPNSLGQHRQRKHEPRSLEKPWQCDTCGKQFKMKNDLRIHEAEKHLQGELPFKCGGCGRGYRLETNLEKHREKCKNEVE